LNRLPHFTRTFLILVFSLLILLIVIQFAPPAIPPASDVGLTTRVAAVTSVPRPATRPRPTLVARAEQPTAQAQNATPSVMYLSAERNGRWELFAVTPETAGEMAEWKQLTRDYTPARAPALSPDGTRLEFQSRKHGNWEIYVLDLASERFGIRRRAELVTGWKPIGFRVVPRAGP
jgi:hypothetical protein